jgi:CheY-like chemotaxis protein
MSEKSDLPEKIRTIRKLRGYSQEELARQLGVSFPTVNAWERGKSTPYPRHQRAIEDMLQEVRSEQGELTVIIVEDDEATGMVLSDFATIALPDYSPTVIDNGYDAILKIGMLKPRVVILDIMMPGIDGLEVFARMKDTPELAETQVVFVSAADESVLAKARDAGAFAVLTKPVNADELIPVLRRAAGLDD